VAKIFCRRLSANDPKIASASQWIHVAQGKDRGTNSKLKHQTLSRAYPLPFSMEPQAQVTSLAGCGLLRRLGHFVVFFPRSLIIYPLLLTAISTGQPLVYSYVYGYSGMCFTCLRPLSSSKLAASNKSKTWQFTSDLKTAVCPRHGTFNISSRVHPTLAAINPCIRS
jgi:hypothetical protein